MKLQQTYLNNYKQRITIDMYQRIKQADAIAKA
jgi:hypothetical protein